MAKRRDSLKPQDVVVLLKLALSRGQEWVIAEIANGACLSLSETHAAIGRLERCHLFDPNTRRPIIASAVEFLLHGLRYVFPAEPNGRQARGMPTAHSAPPLRDRIVCGAQGLYVWPCPYGQARGMSLPPLYRTVPQAAQKDAEVYELLALADAICVGRARERELAGDLMVAKLREEGGQ